VDRPVAHDSSPFLPWYARRSRDSSHQPAERPTCSASRWVSGHRFTTTHAAEFSATRLGFAPRETRPQVVAQWARSREPEVRGRSSTARFKSRLPASRYWPALRSARIASASSSATRTQTGRRRPRRPFPQVVPEQVPGDHVLPEEPSQSHLIHGPHIGFHGESCTTKSGPEPSFGPGHGHRGVGGPPFASGRPRSLRPETQARSGVVRRSRVIPLESGVPTPSSGRSSAPSGIPLPSVGKACYNLPVRRRRRQAEIP
jgi:hypothetical protein